MLCTCLESIINVTLDLEENKKPNPYGKAKYIMTENLKSLLCAWCYFLSLPKRESSEEVAFYIAW